MRSVPTTCAAQGVTSGSIYMSRSRIMARIKTKVAKVEGITVEGTNLE